MNSEEVILLVFVGLVVVGVPILLWGIEREKKQSEKEEREKWIRKNKEKMQNQNK